MSQMKYLPFLSGTYGLNNLVTEIMRCNTVTDQIEGDRSLSLFDALCSQLQEDFAICQLTENDNRLVALHICAPNHWAEEDKIRRNFDIVHETVPGMENRNHMYKRCFNRLF